MRNPTAVCFQAHKYQRQNSEKGKMVGSSYKFCKLIKADILNYQFSEYIR